MWNSDQWRTMEVLFLSCILPHTCLAGFWLWQWVSCLFYSVKLCWEMMLRLWKCYAFLFTIFHQWRSDQIASGWQWHVEHKSQLSPWSFSTLYYTLCVDIFKGSVHTHHCFVTSLSQGALVSWHGAGPVQSKFGRLARGARSVWQFGSLVDRGETRWVWRRSSGRRDGFFTAHW